MDRTSPTCTAARPRTSTRSSRGPSPATCPSSNPTSWSLSSTSKPRRRSASAFPSRSCSGQIGSLSESRQPPNIALQRPGGSRCSPPAAERERSPHQGTHYDRRRRLRHAAMVVRVGVLVLFAFLSPPATVGAGPVGPAYAQQQPAGKVYRIGFLSQGQLPKAYVEALQQGLRE